MKENWKKNMKENLKVYGVATLMIPQYAVTRTLYMMGWVLIAVANLINGDLDKVKKLKLKQEAA